MRAEDFNLGDQGRLIKMATLILIEKIIWTIDGFYSEECVSASIPVTFDRIAPFVREELEVNDWSSELDVLPVQDVAEMLALAVYMDALAFICPAAKHLTRRIDLIESELAASRISDDSRAYELDRLVQMVEVGLIPKHAWTHRPWDARGILITDQPNLLLDPLDVIQVVTKDPETTSLLSWAFSNARRILKYKTGNPDKTYVYSTLAQSAIEAVSFDNDPRAIVIRFLNGLKSLRSELWSMEQQARMADIARIRSMIDSSIRYRMHGDLMT
jgi:hypothetical protein